MLRLSIVARRDLLGIEIDFIFVISIFERCVCIVLELLLAGSRQAEICMACTLIFAIDDFLSGRFSLKLHDSSNWHSTSIELLYDLRATQRALQEDRNARLLEVLILISYNRGVLLRHDWTGIILHFNSFILFTVLLLSSEKVQIIAFFEKLSFSYLYLLSSWLERISGEPFVIFVVLRPLDITLFKRMCVDKRHDFLWP